MDKKAFNGIMGVIEKEKLLGDEQLWKDIAQAKLDIHNTWLRLLSLVGQREEFLCEHWCGGAKLILGQILSSEGMNTHMLAMFKLHYLACHDNLMQQYKIMKKLEKAGQLETFMNRLKDYGKSEFERRWRAAVAVEKTSTIYLDELFLADDYLKHRNPLSLKLLREGNFRIPLRGLDTTA